MLDIKLIRTNPELVKENIKKKFQDHKLPLVDEAYELDILSRKYITQASYLRGKKNSLSKEIGKLFATGQKQQAEEVKKEIAAIDQQLKDLEVVEESTKAKLKEIMMKIPNIIDETVPIGKDDSENVEIKKYGDPVIPNFEIPYHTEIMEKLKGIDLDSARKVAGN